VAVAHRRVTWLGHATVLIEVGGARLLTDPVLRRRVAHLRRHAPGPAPARPRQVDAVLLSHLHHDHADLPTLRRLALPIVAPRGAARVLSGLGVREVEVGEELTIGGAGVRVVPADHDVRRVPWGPRSPAVGFVVDGIYFAGDTGLFDGMAAVAPVDAALLPIWGWGPKLGPGHLDPEAAARALTLLRPRVAVPIHWGTFLPLGGRRRHGHLLSAPAEEFARRAATVAPEVRVAMVPPGGTVELGR
jgi:L-ascorbate metabolism protein UlaG (beta-lactamase superfamily)